MATTYKTPGVYIEEISKFPPSIAEVATAIPVFIGYTEKVIIDGIDLAKEASDKKKVAADAQKALADSDLAKALKTAQDALKTAQTALENAKKALEATPDDQAKKDAVTNAEKAVSDAQSAVDAAQKAADDSDLGKAAKAAQDQADEAGMPIPVRITSLLEYEQSFGKTEPAQGIIVMIEETLNQSVVVDRKVTGSIQESPKHNLYYAMQAYFKNGGGPGYVVSVGTMAEAKGVISAADLQRGIEAIAKEDEVTLFVFPESQALNDADRAGVFGDALNQCGKLQDRFVIMDMQ
ncbi:hypothetical protein IQ250_24885, partial [Pseudanabaenaceae cyanobacterium LEGE 13415]|nr:hypothetical protein [Pseudanabaenaceae cyanobacterium LEGE 13415]